ncbi:MAG: NUDIX domain-containing protein [Deltaproteobacteria bacterium]|nr:NUDIX domain-containing protein [Deltaproteobacteria bacterium]
MDTGPGRARWVVAVAVVVVRDGRVLALRRAADRDAGAGAWETVSGRVEHHETLVEAAARECREETGSAPVVDPIPVAAYTARRAGEPMVVIAFAAAATTETVRRSAEHDAHAWLTPDEMATRCPFPQLVAAVHDAVARCTAASNVTSDGAVGYGDDGGEVR